MRELPEQEIALWLAYFEDEPALSQRVDIQFANQNALILNALSSFAGGKKKITTDDVGLFFPLQKQEEKNDDDTPLYIALQNEINQ